MEIFEKILGLIFTYYTLTLVPTLLVARTFPKRDHFWLRLVLSACIGYGLVMLVELVPNIIILGKPFMIRFLFAYFVCAFIVAVSFRVNWKEVVFCTVAGGLMQHLSSQFWMMTRQFLRAGGIDAKQAILEPIMAAIVYLVGYFVFIRRLKKDAISFVNRERLVVVAMVMFIFVYFGAYIAHVLVSWNDGVAAYVIVNLYDVVICSLCLGFQFGIFNEAVLQEDNTTLEQLLIQQGKQQQLSQSTLELIHITGHDLKKRIELVRSMQDSAEKEQLLSSLEHEVRAYDRIANTGNEALDVVLTEKAMYCERHDITFNYLVDCKNLAFLNATEVYSLFGNAIDNAIEYLEKKPKELRTIDLRIMNKSGMLQIFVRNFCDDQITLKDGLPVSGKGADHGYGMKSIRYIVDKYNGGLSVIAKDNEFSLNILINPPTT